MGQLLLWKRCRILACSVRLDMLVCLADVPRLYVQQIAGELGLSEDVASKHLKLLASGGFLRSDAESKYLYYQLVESNELGTAVLRKMLSEKDSKHSSVLRELTALTHERRVSVVSILKGTPAVRMDDLFFRGQMSEMAGRRHLNKLVSRGWVSVEDRVCRLRSPSNRLAAVLIDAV